MVRIAYSREKKIPNSTLLLSINDQKIDDFLEYQFYNDMTNTRKILIENKGVKKEVVFEPDEKIAIELEEPVYRQCENDCDFCFINGLPKGLRKKLYFTLYTPEVGKLEQQHPVIDPVGCARQGVAVFVEHQVDMAPGTIDVIYQQV